jgi:hypothetical protein
MVNFTIILNVACMLSVVYDMTPLHETILEYVELGCLAVYYTEMIVLILADAWHYFLDRHSLFDFCITVVSTIDVAQSWLALSQGGGGSVGMQALRATRVLRLVRIAHRQPDIAVMARSTARAFRESLGCFVLMFTTLMVRHAPRAPRPVASRVRGPLRARQGR